MFYDSINMPSLWWTWHQLTEKGGIWDSNLSEIKIVEKPLCQA